MENTIQTDRNADGSHFREFRIQVKIFPSKEIFDPPQPLGCLKLAK
jgi:hypothetical protein